MESGFDNDVKKYFLKVLYSLSWSLMWMVLFIRLGIYDGLAFIDGKPVLYNILFYVFITAALVALIYYLYNTWKHSGK
jgi:hypothetical protein